MLVIILRTHVMSGHYNLIVSYAAHHNYWNFFSPLVLLRRFYHAPRQCSDLWSCDHATMRQCDHAIMRSGSVISMLNNNTWTVYISLTVNLVHIEFFINQYWNSWYALVSTCIFKVNTCEYVIAFHIVRLYRTIVMPIREMAWASM